MLPQASSGDWDFTPAITLIRSQSASNARQPADRSPSNQQARTKNLHTLPGITSVGNEGETLGGSLGEFSLIFSLLGTTSYPPSQSLDDDATRYANSTLVPDVADTADGVFRNGTGESHSCSETSHHLSTVSLQNLDSICSTSSAGLEGQPSRSDEVLRGLETESKGLHYGRGPNFSESDTRRAIIQQVINNARSRDQISSTSWHPKYQNLTPASVRPTANGQQTARKQNVQLLGTHFDKKVQLLSLLSKNFPSDRMSLSRLVSVPDYMTLAPPSRAIHVFVDISNILIGFHDAIKQRRGFSKEHRIPREHLSFHNLSLILERGRPAVKRVVVGSDDVGSIREAQAIGYEINILERVVKIRGPKTQRRMHQVPGIFGVSSSSEDNKSVPARKVEQGVDEILHLKMLESILDTTEPSTMVLATGDAGEAEYSEGFKRMVERALIKNWKVELVSFRENISWAWRNPDWRSRWPGFFTITELDEYVELLRL